MKLINGFMVFVAAALLAGCGGSGVDENKPVEEIAAEAAEMGQAELQKMVDKYETAIADKVDELDALKAQIKEIPLTEMMGEKAKTLKEDVSEITGSLNTLKDQLAEYTKALSAK